jgi:hypothetical protein
MKPAAATMLADATEARNDLRYHLLRLLNLAIDHNDPGLQQLVMQEAERSAIEYTRAVIAVVVSHSTGGA